MSEYQVGPYVNFQGRAREAMEFYQSVLGGNLILKSVREDGAVKDAGEGDRIAYARLDADGIVIIATDGHPNFPPSVGENIALALVGADKEQIAEIYNRLAEGGKAKMRLTPQPWGVEVGYLLDKFDINWMVGVDRA
jgi:PhnB protein